MAQLVPQQQLSIVLMFHHTKVNFPSADIKQLPLINEWTWIDWSLFIQTELLYALT